MDNFDRNFTRAAGAVIAAWIVFALVDLALLLVVIWAIFKVVNHYA